MAVDAADKLLAVVAPVLGTPQLGYLKNYIAINIGRNNYFWLHKRSGNKSLLGFRIAPHLADDAQQILDEAKISFTRKPKLILITVDLSAIESNAESFAKIAALVKRTWDKDS